MEAAIGSRCFIFSVGSERKLANYFAETLELSCGVFRQLALSRFPQVRLSRLRPVLRSRTPRSKRPDGRQSQCENARGIHIPSRAWALRSGV